MTCSNRLRETIRPSRRGTNVSFQYHISPNLTKPIENELCNRPFFCSSSLYEGQRTVPRRIVFFLRYSHLWKQGNLRAAITDMHSWCCQCLHLHKQHFPPSKRRMRSKRRVPINLWCFVMSISWNLNIIILKKKNAFLFKSFLNYYFSSIINAVTILTESKQRRIFYRCSKT